MVGKSSQTDAIFQLGISLATNMHEPRDHGNDAYLTCKQIDMQICNIVGLLGFKIMFSAGWCCEKSSPKLRNKVLLRQHD